MRMQPMGPRSRLHDRRKQKRARQQEHGQHHDADKDGHEEEFTRAHREYLPEEKRIGLVRIATGKAQGKGTAC